MNRATSILLACILLAVSVHAKDKDKDKKDEPLYEMSGAQALKLMAAHEHAIVAQIQSTLAQQAYADAMTEIRKANNWPDDVYLDEKTLKIVKPPAPEPAKPEEKKLEEKPPDTKP